MGGANGEQIGRRSIGEVEQDSPGDHQLGAMWVLGVAVTAVCGARKVTESTFVNKDCSPNCWMLNRA